MDSSSRPPSFIIIGAGIFGLSTALAISRRLPSAKVTVIDRGTPPVEDATSVDTTRCIRADYADPIYARLAAKAQQIIEDDRELRPHYFKQGMTFVCDGKPSRFHDIWEKGLRNVRERQPPNTLVELQSPEEVFSRIHGPESKPVADTELGRERRWNKGYCNLEDAFIDAGESIRVYYKRCLKQKAITFLCDTTVEKICVHDGIAKAVQLDDGRIVEADTILVATGAWSNRLVHLEGLAFSSAIEVAWVKLTDAEVAAWKKMSITTNLSTGFNMFPPHRGEIKMLRRSSGYRNTIRIPHPEDPSREISISHPRTTVTNPGDHIPKDAETSLRDDLKELMPSLADRPFDRTKLCWYVYCICFKPRYVVPLPN